MVNVVMLRLPIFVWVRSGVIGPAVIEGAKPAAGVSRLQLDQVSDWDRMCHEASASRTAIRLSGTLRNVRFVSRPGCRSCRHPRRDVSCTDRLSIKPFGGLATKYSLRHFGAFVTVASVVKAVCEVFHTLAVAGSGCRDPIGQSSAGVKPCEQVGATARIRLDELLLARDIADRVRT
jgi:hypothetical protein